MSPKLLALVGLRAAALALAIAGQTRASNTLYSLADAAESEADVDAHMQAVADKLKSRPTTDADWDDVTARIEADLARIRGS